MPFHIVVSFTQKTFRLCPPQLDRCLIYGNTVIMDYETFESFGSRPVMGCFNIVLVPSAHSADSDVHNLIFIKNICEIDVLDQNEDIFILGGYQLYAYYMMHAATIYATIIEKERDDGGESFPCRYFHQFIIAEASDRIWNTTHNCFSRYIRYAAAANADADAANAAVAEEQEYLKLINTILVHGSARPDRTGIGTMSLFGEHLQFDIRNHVPFITTKTLAWRAVIHELLWFLRGSSDSKELESAGVNIWKGNTSRAFLDSRGLFDYHEGETGPLYGHALRHYGAPYGSKAGYDQLESLVASIKNDPFSRRHVLTTYNPEVVDQCVLAPCHGIAIQFYVEDNLGLSCQVYCRSSDVFLGLPFNIASYAVLTYLVAKKTGYQPKSLKMTLGDAHIYANHVTQSWTQVGRDPLPFPKLKVCDSVVEKDWEKITIDDFELIGYISHPAIKAEMAI